MVAPATLERLESRVVWGWRRWWYWCEWITWSLTLLPVYCSSYKFLVSANLSLIVIPGLSSFPGQGWWTWTKGTRSMEQILAILCCITFVVGKRSCSILVSHFSSHYVCTPITCTQTNSLLLTSHTNCRVQQGTRTTRTTWTAWENGKPGVAVCM